VAFLGQGTDVFVIGGGPAGLAAAIAVRRKGLSVTVADGAQPPIDKACGEGMLPETQAALKEIGVELPSGTGYRLRGIRFVEERKQVEAEFPEGHGIGMRRTVLHELLLREAEKCGVKLLWKTPVVGIGNNEVHLGGGTMFARWIVGADGGHSRVRKWSELNSRVTQSRRLAIRRHYRVRPWTDFMEIYWGPGVQAYVTPVSEEEVCVAALGESAEDADFGRVQNLLPELRERLMGAELSNRERGAMTAMRSLARVWRGSVALVGDASGGVDAITGEGLRLAFRQAQALAEAISVGDLREYGRAHRKLARRPRQVGSFMLRVGRYDGMRSRVLRMLRRNPGLFARLLAIHGGRASTGEVVVVGAQVGWQFLAS
jgi:menaquinone-9 beta-reductase